MKKTIKKVVIVGGGASGWMTAAMLAKMLGNHLDITLVESPDIGIIGVGEATIPAIQIFNQILGIKEADFIKYTKATFKLGIQFENWSTEREKYIHAFGVIGAQIGPCDFYNYWLRCKNKYELWDFSINAAAAKENKFEAKDKGFLKYAYHFDAILYAKYLANYSQDLGVERIEAKVEKVNVNKVSGHIDSILLDSEQTISGDLFIDCTGFKALLIEEALHTGYEDWTHWLPTNSAIAVPSKHINNEISPYTRAIAHKVGWQWRIPLQHRVGNGLVYSDKYIDKQEAERLLLSNIEGELLSKPRHFSFTTGKRKKLWNKNCVAIGLSSGFLEPLESTSLYLIQSSIVRLIKLFPSECLCNEEINEYNKQADLEFESIRDFIILHYKATTRQDSSFWKDRVAMDIPASLMHKIKLFKENGRIFKAEEDIFAKEAWVQVLVGQGVVPNSVDPLAEQMDSQKLENILNNYIKQIAIVIENIPLHKDYLSQF